MNDYKSLVDWIPTFIAITALGAFWVLVRSSVENMKLTLKEELQKVWEEINRIHKDYMEEEKHALICGNTALQTEKFFRKSFDELKDVIFERLRAIEAEIKRSNGSNKDERP